MALGLAFGLGFAFGFDRPLGFGRRPAFGRALGFERAFDFGPVRFAVLEREVVFFRFVLVFRDLRDLEALLNLPDDRDRAIRGPPIHEKQ